MHISQYQMAALERGTTRVFVRRLCAYIERDFAGQRAHSGEAIPVGQALEQRVQKCVSAAAGFGITTELGVGQFVVLDVAYAREFYQMPRVVEMLGDPRHEPDLNIQRVLEAVVIAEARSH